MIERVELRIATPADAATVAWLHAASWRDAYRGMLSDSFLDGPVEDERGRMWAARFADGRPERRTVVLAEQSGAPVGFACVLLDEEPAWGACLDNLHMLPGERGRGVGRALLASAARWAAAAEPGWGMHLWVFEANAQARRFYEAAGGAAVERGLKRLPDGGDHLLVRYHWPDIGDLLARLGGSA